MRYIRRGHEEDWQPFNAANSFKQALEYIDNAAIPLCPELSALQVSRHEAKVAEEEKARAERKAKGVRLEAEERTKRSQEAFSQLRDSKDGKWANRWNVVVAEAQRKPKLFEGLEQSAKFRELHAAVINAMTVPTKRKAIRLALAWLAREHGITFQD